jgi:hypothetical protein
MEGWEKRKGRARRAAIGSGLAAARRGGRFGTLPYGEKSSLLLEAWFFLMTVKTAVVNAPGS